MSSASVMLENPEIRARISPVTVAQYHQFAEFDEHGHRTELIRGILIEKMSKSPLHASVARRLFQILQDSLPEGHILLREDPLTFADSEPEPDLAIVRGVEEDFVTRHPSTAALVVEIAVTSIALDREKAAIYAEAGVAEYWIILPAERRVEIYRRPEGSSYRESRVMEGNGSIACEALPSLQVDLAEIFG
ncbi:Uma2 family endonuclease [Luteolibacter flavescens]|uniref:Uma2 family endonuclease n=1 Tax=Luteolibacter flavescens TaxID=1859460 RepID=A0ABT3FMV7_9BACT|nr:Uma2 family endonuclease [Luteolibacter flavescens]MCW1884907.1 Uma2 family endonuclease [Luteolibacter flavescens]